MKTFSAIRRSVLLLACAVVPVVFAAAPQSVSIVAPPNGAQITVAPSSPVTITANATSSTANASISQIDFRVNGASIGTVVGGSSSVSLSTPWQPTAVGTYTLTAVASDSSSATGNTLTATATVTVTSVTATTTSYQFVSVTAPASNTTFAQNSTSYVRANATMSGGIVSSVEFFITSNVAGSTPQSLGTSTTAPYNRLVTFSGAPGGYTLTAHATGSGGESFDSAAVPITIAPAVGAAPTISITSPTVTDIVAVGGNVTVSANAADADGSITGVAFFADGEQIGNTDTAAPYSVTWVPTGVRNYSLTAIAVDNNSNARVSSAVTVNVRASAATVAVTAPAAGSSAAVGVPVTLTATATPSAGSTIASVEFLVNGDPITNGTDTTAPYSVSWTPQGTGTATITARATDSNNVVVTSSPVTVSVGNSTPPTINLTAPTGGATIALGATVSVTANATASSGLSIATVQFTANGANIGSDTTSPYGITWTPTTAGLTTLTATAVDTAGGTTTSNPVVVTVTSTNPTLTVNLTNSGSNSIPSGSTRALTVTTTPTTGITQVELLYDGNVIATDTTAPYNFLFTAPDSLGAHQLTARATDAASGTGTSTPLAITITSAVGQQPLIGITTPAANSFLGPNVATIISGTAVDNDGGVTSVQVYVNGATGAAAGLSTGSGTTANTTGAAVISGNSWSINWTPTTSGIYSITAIATDANGNAIAAVPVNVTVGDASSPTLSLVLLPGTATNQASSTLPSGAVRNIVANATASSGRAVVRVEFFVDGTKVGEDTTAPFTYRYVAPPLDASEQSHTFVFSARATDNAGAARDAFQPLLVVQPVGTPPTVNLLTPPNNASVFPNTDVSMAATAVPASGASIVSVQFFVNGNLTGITTTNPVTAAPYVGTFRPTAPGSYTIDAIATDDRGNTAISNSVTVIAAFSTPTVTITSPNPNATARATPGVPLNLSATAVVQSGASTGAGILLVEFLLDDVQIGARTAPTTTGGSTYTFSWTPTAAQLGQHRLTARVTDTNSQTATSAPVTVNVATVVGTPPTINITQPAAGTGAGQAGNLQSLSTVNFVANAASSVGTISSVEFFLNDVSIGTGTREQATNTYRLAYDLSRFDLTTAPSVIDPNTGVTRYTPIPLYAIARDNSNNQTVTNPINLTINTSTSSPPSITLQAFSPTTVTQGTQFLILPTFNDSDGTVTQLQLFANGALVQTVTNPQPFSALIYNTTTAGRFNLYAVVTDDTANTAVSSPAIPVNVTAVSAPPTTITRPTDDSTVTTVGAPVFLEGTATNADSTQVPSLLFIATSSSGSVRTQIGGQRVGTTSTYRAIWTPTAPGTYSVVTQASVGTVQSTSTVSRTVVVNNLLGLAPSVSIANGVPTTAQTASTSNFSATATDPDGSVVEVEFFLNRNSIGKAVQDPGANTWRLTANFAGVLPGSVEVVALARDSSGNVAASTTNTITVTAAQSIAPTITITPSTTNAAFNRQVQLRANARDTDGTINSVQYFANATSLGSTGNSGTNYQVNWTPNQSGLFRIWAVATDNSGVTTVSSTVEVTVRRNNPVLENAAFILQTYQDIGNTTNIISDTFNDLDDQLARGTLTRAQLVSNLITNSETSPGFDAPVNLLAAYYAIMGEWPTPANYTTLLATARGSLANAVGSILSSSRYGFKFNNGGTTSSNTLTNAFNADFAVLKAFATRLWVNAGRGTPSDLQVTQFRSNPTVVSAPPLGPLGRGYAVGGVGLNTAIAEFITVTNSTNDQFLRMAKVAAMYYQLDRPPTPTGLTDGQIIEPITARINELMKLADLTAVADSVLKDTLYLYRYVTITRQPESLVVAPRSGVILSVEAQGAPPLAYQWLLNGAPVAGATNATLSLTNVDTRNVGAYTVVVTSPAASDKSDPANLTLSSVPTRLANISTRGQTNGGANVLIGGFVVSGTNQTQTRQMLIRVIGPSLAGAPFNVQGTLADPRLELYAANSATPVLQNDNWANQQGGAAQVTAIQQATNRIGAFTLNQNSLDAVVLATLPPGTYTVQAKGPANNPNASGVVLIEAYDVTPNAAAPGKAMNVSTRGAVGTGTNILIAGFVVNGGVSRRVLIRGVGPTLTRFGLAANAVLANPQLTLINQDTGRTIATNDDWASDDSTAGVIAAASTTAGAFALTNGSKDAAMIVMLAPGAYTVQLSGVNNGQGIAIVEVYDVDP